MRELRTKSFCNCREDGEIGLRDLEAKVGLHLGSGHSHWTGPSGRAEEEYNGRGTTKTVSYLTSRQRARMADLSLLLDVILKTTSSGWVSRSLRGVSNRSREQFSVALAALLCLLIHSSWGHNAISVVLPSSHRLLVSAALRRSSANAGFFGSSKVLWADVLGPPI